MDENKSDSSKKYKSPKIFISSRKEASFQASIISSASIRMPPDIDDDILEEYEMEQRSLMPQPQPVVERHQKPPVRKQEYEAVPNKQEDEDDSHNDHPSSGIFFVLFSWMNYYIHKFNKYGEKFKLSSCRDPEKAKHNHERWNEKRQNLKKPEMENQFLKTFILFAGPRLFWTCLIYFVSILAGFFTFVSTF